MARAVVGPDCLVDVLVARPHGHRHLRRVAAPPQVVAVVGGAGLAGHGLIDLEGVEHRVGRPARLRDDALEHLGGHLGHALVDDARGVVLVLVDHVAVAVLDLGDGHRVTAQAAARERGVGLGHLERARELGAQDGGAVGLEVARDAHLLGRGHHLVVAKHAGHLHVAGVGRDGRGVGECHRAVGFVAVVLHAPGAAHLDGRVAVDEHRRVHAVLEGGDEREHLEARAGLLGGRGGGVHLGARARAVEVLAAHHRLDVAGGGVDGHEGAIKLAVARLAEQARHGALRGALPRGVEGGVDLEAALDDGLLREVALEQALHIVGPVGVGALVVEVGVARVQHHVLGRGLVVLLLGDVAQAQHVVEDLVAARLGGVGVLRGIVVGRRVGQADEKRRLGQREVARMLVEVRDARGLDAVGAVAVVDGVEVHHENLILGVHLLHLDGDVGLAHLSLERLLELLVGEHGVAHELLRDGGGTLVSADELREHGAHDARRVDAVVLVEALVLDVDGALEHVVGDLVGRDRAAVLRVEGGDGVALGVVDLARLGDEIGVGGGVVGQVLEPRLDERAKRNRERYREKDQKAEHAGGGEADDVRLGPGVRATVANSHANPPMRLHRVTAIIRQIAGRDDPRADRILCSHRQGSAGEGGAWAAGCGVAWPRHATMPRRG